MSVARPYSTAYLQGLASEQFQTPLHFSLASRPRLLGRKAQTFRKSNFSQRNALKDSFTLSLGRKGMQAHAVQRTLPELYEGIADFYDSSSPAWEDIWGEHMHHGYYPAGSKVSDLKDHQRAQVEMIDRVLSWAGVGEGGEPGPSTVVDVGCGIGGSSRHLSRKFGSKVTGITLSPLQARRANAITTAAGLSDRVAFQVANALEQPFADKSFDLVWSLESGEHMPDKQKFVGELARVCAPGGRIIIVTWCHRTLKPGEEALTRLEQILLDRVCDAYYLPAWCSTDEYVKIAKGLGLEDIRTADWSDNISPFWPAVIESALSLKGLMALARSGLKTFRGALAMALMVQGYNMGLIKFELITARVPRA